MADHFKPLVSVWYFAPQLLIRLPSFIQMNEQERREYLHRMGYDVYYPRYQIPGARPSPDYDFPASSQTDDKAPAHDLQRESAPQPETLVSTPGKSETGRRVQSVKPEQPPENQDADDLRFSLQYFAINEVLAIINEAPHQLRGKQNRDSMNLLQAILDALLPDGEDLSLAAVEFAWPIAEGLAAADPRRAAALALQGFINQRQEQDQFSNLLIFSGQIHRLLLPQAADESYGDQVSEQLQSQLTVTHSLQSMLVHPLLKRETWAHLQPLRQRLRV